MPFEVENYLKYPKKNSSQRLQYILRLLFFCHRGNYFKKQIILNTFPLLQNFEKVYLNKITIKLYKQFHKIVDLSSLQK